MDPEEEELRRLTEENTRLAQQKGLAPVNGTYTAPDVMKNLNDYAMNLSNKFPGKNVSIDMIRKSIKNDPGLNDDAKRLLLQNENYIYNAPVLTMNRDIQGARDKVIWEDELPWYEGLVQPASDLVRTFYPEEGLGGLSKTNASKIATGVDIATTIAPAAKGILAGVGLASRATAPVFSKIASALGAKLTTDKMEKAVAQKMAENATKITNLQERAASIKDARNTLQAGDKARRANMTEAQAKQLIDEEKPFKDMYPDVDDIIEREQYIADANKKLSDISVEARNLMMDNKKIGSVYGQQSYIRPAIMMQSAAKQVPYRAVAKTATGLRDEDTTFLGGTR